MRLTQGIILWSCMAVAKGGPPPHVRGLLVANNIHVHVHVSHTEWLQATIVQYEYLNTTTYVHDGYNQSHT